MAKVLVKEGEENAFKIASENDYIDINKYLHGHENHYN